MFFLKTYLYGCGPHGKVVLDILHRQGRGVTAFVDDSPPLEITEIHNVPIYQADEALYAIEPERSQWIVTIGNIAIRQHIADKLYRRGHSFTTAIHPSAEIGSGVEIGVGSVVMPNTVINIDSKIGSHVIINTGSTIDHDCIVGNYSHIAPGCSICGGVNIGESAFLGVGTCVSPFVEIGEHTTCGAGSVVIRSLPSQCLAYGCPAKVVQTSYSK
jgi:acetyltransferase EpsM